MSTIIPVRVRAAWTEAEGVRAVEFEHAEGAPLPGFTPGSHIDLRLPDGLVRQYSLCNGPDEPDCYRIAVKLEPLSRGGSRQVHEALAPGDRLEIHALRNLFPLHDDAPAAVLLAGGIGLTPLLSMALALRKRRRPFALLVFNREPGMTAFRATLQGEGLREHTQVLTGLDPDQTRQAIAAALEAMPGGAHLYTCGPAPFMDAAFEMATAAGWPAERLHREHFAAAAPVAAGGGSFTAEARRSGVTVEVGLDESLADALVRGGVAVELSCEQGICGTCLTRVLDGLPDHRDSFLTDGERQANDAMCLCVSRALSGHLVLDL
jgi:Flavodoxin reductases (ferredoxin-NADPH reductases) family 1